MEGVAVATGIDKLITTLGISGSIIVLCVVAFFIIREVKKENAATRTSADSLKKSTELLKESIGAQIKGLQESRQAQLDGLRKSLETKIAEQQRSLEERLEKLGEQSDARDREIERRLEKTEKDIKFLEKDFVSKDMLYRETEGWRSEIQLLRSEISRLPFELLKLEGRKEK